MTDASKHLPPVHRTALWDKITTAARTTGNLVLPVCLACQVIQYPPREICRVCLSDKLEWRPVNTDGKLLSFTQVHASVEPYFRERAPWPVGLVKLDCGPIMFTHLQDGINQVGQGVRVNNVLDESGQAVFVAVPVS